MLSSNTSAANGAANYIEDVFSTYLYTGNGSTRTITNGIDLAGKGGLVWIKSRNAVRNNVLTDTVNGENIQLFSNDTLIGNSTTALSSFDSSGFSIGANANINTSADNLVSWTFRKQPKFFDVVTYTGNGTAPRNIPHNLGSAPGCMIVKRTDTTSTWSVYHQSLGDQRRLTLETTDAMSGLTGIWSNTSPTDAVFTVSSGVLNTSGATYVAYLFAHDAGGFGLTGTDNVISCGSYTGTGAAGNFVSLGYEPQWLLIKRTNTTGNWLVLDTMRGIVTGGVDAGLFPNLANAEDSANDYLSVNATGFELTGVSTTVNASGSTYIYIAIRRGPMKVPTTGTKVFSPIVSTGSGTPAVVTGFVTDSSIATYRTAGFGNSFKHYWGSRLTGSNSLETQTTAAEQAPSNFNGFDWGYNNGIGNAGDIASNYILWNFQRAPGFFDEVCYTGTGSSSTVAHNLAAVPELLIVKKRSAVNDWYVMGLFTPTTHGYGNLNLTDNWSLNQTYAAAGLLTGQPTSTGFTVSSSSGVLTASGATYVAYLFASAPGVSKVGTYTGNGVNAAGGGQTINCGFTAGARFVLIKRTNSTGDWYVFDTARGIVAAADPYFKLNTAEAEVTTIDVVDTASSGFIVNQEANTNLNVNAATYIFLAIA